MDNRALTDAAILKEELIKLLDEYNDRNPGIMIDIEVLYVKTKCYPEGQPIVKMALRTKTEI